MEGGLNGRRKGGRWSGHDVGMEILKHHVSGLETLGKGESWAGGRVSWEISRGGEDDITDMGYIFQPYKLLSRRMRS